MGELNQYLINAKREYADKWENDAKYYYNNNFYRWMEIGIKDKKNVLEIGCGVGYSTLQLLQLGHQVISVDYNRECLLRTKSLLEEYEYKVRIMKREQLQTYGRSYETEYASIENDYDSQYTYLIEGDILQDSNLMEWLTTVHIDAIVGWLIGGHKAIALRGFYRNLGINSDSDYRMRIEDSIYLYGNQLLKVGGTINFVSRIMYPTDSDLKEELDGIREELDIESRYKIQMVGFKEYSEIDNGIEMHPNNTERLLDNRKAVLSVNLIKEH